MTPAELQQALAKSQQDLTEALRRAADLEQVRAELSETKATLDVFVEDNQRLEGENADLVNRSLVLKAELASARAELEQLRAEHGWIVARDGGRHCERCEGEVRRGEAYEEQPGTGGLIQHIHCPPDERSNP